MNKRDKKTKENEKIPTGPKLVFIRNFFKVNLGIFARVFFEYRKIFQTKIIMMFDNTKNRAAIALNAHKDAVIPAENELPMNACMKNP